MTETLWKVDDLSRYLKIKDATIRYWVHLDYIPYIKFKGAVRFYPPKIFKWLESLERVPAIMMSEKVSSRITMKNTEEVT